MVNIYIMKIYFKSFAFYESWTIMNRKKMFIDILIIMMALALFIAWDRHDKADTAVTNTLLNQDYKIYLITVDKKAQYWDILNQGARDMAALLGLTYAWDAPAERNIQLQIDVLNNAVNNGANAILLAADSPKKISAAVEDAKARGVKIIYVDSPANEEAIITLATDNEHAGTLAGNTMRTQLEDAGIVSGKIGIISVDSTKENTMLREKSFRKVLEANGKFTILDTEYMGGDLIASQEAASKLIKENPDLVGLFGTNETTSIGVGNAILNNNINIIGIGFDKTEKMLILLNKDGVRALMVQYPYTMGYLGVAEAVAALKGYDTGPFFLDTGVTVLEKQ